MDQDNLSELIAKSYRGLLELLEGGVQDRSVLSQEMNRSIADLTDADAEQFIVHFGSFCFLVASESIRRASEVNSENESTTTLALRVSGYCSAVAGMEVDEFTEFFGYIVSGDESVSKYATRGVFAAVAIEFALNMSGTDSLKDKLPSIERIMRHK